MGAIRKLIDGADNSDELVKSKMRILIPYPN